MVKRIAELLGIADECRWSHGYYSFVGQKPGDLQRPRWRIETPRGFQFFAPDNIVARKGDILIPALSGLDAGHDSDEEAQRRVLSFLEACDGKVSFCK